MGLWLLLIAGAVVFGLFVRELWRLGSAWHRARAKQREREAAKREQAEQLAERETAALSEPGGTPERPIEVQAASVVEARADAEPCLRCEGPVRVDEHAAEKHGNRRLRVVQVECPRCGYRRTRYFAIADSEPALH